MLPLKPHFPWWLRNTKVSILTQLSHLKGLWSHWDLRSFILLSLCLQVTLILIAPFRKKTGNFVVISVIWLAYLLADYVAIQAVGLIPKHSDKSTLVVVDAAYSTHPDLLAFWAPFLLVHLGGPDPITALALEDNELWLRTFLHLLTYGYATARVFFQSLPSNILAIPTILMFVTGILKYVERTLSLYSARLTQFKSSMLDKPDPGPNYAKLMDTYDSYLNSNLPAKFDTNPEPDQYNAYAAFSIEQKDEDGNETELDDLEDNPQTDKKIQIGPSKEDKSQEKKLESQKKKQENQKKLKNVKLVRDAYDFYDKFKGLYVDLIFTFHDRNVSRTYFLKSGLKAEEAFTLLEMELNFTYEVFYTKMIVIHQTRGFWMRFSSSSFQVLSLLIWILFIGKDEFKGIDIGITYTLLVGAILIDLIALVMVMASDWQLAMLNKESERRASWYDKLLSARKRTWGGAWGWKDSNWGQWTRRVLFRRWSESVPQFNLIHYRVDPWSTGMDIFFKLVSPLKEKLEGWEYVSKKWFANDLRDFIYEELRYKSGIAEEPSDANEICDSKGDWVLRSLAGGLDFEPFEFYKWTCDVEYDECLLLWHIATELLLYQDKDCDTTEKDKTDYRKFSKTLSDYMMYLLYRQPVLMLGVAGISDVRFRDTCAEATVFFDRVLPKRKKEERMKDRIKTACERMMDVNTDTPPKDIKGDKSKSVLFDAVQLAKELKKVNMKLVLVNGKPVKENGKDKREKGTAYVGMWELIAKVWVELLSYAATHTRASAHAAQLKQGGELLTLVWLLMVHLGLGKQFRITQGNARSKLIISK